MTKFTYSWYTDNELTKMTNVTEMYLNSLSEDILTLSLERRGLTSLPDLTRFKNLKELYCCDNLLTSLPTTNLPQSIEILMCSGNKLTDLSDLTRFTNLKEFYCSVNKLTSFPNHLPQGLEKLHCSHNQFTSFPNLPPNLIFFNCANNLLNSLPTLPRTLKELYCFDNYLTSLPTLPENMLCILYFYNPICNIVYIPYNNMVKLKQNINIVNNFCHLLCCLQFKKKFVKWLWKSREKKIMEKYHPKYLLENLEENTDLDEFLNNW